MTRIHGNLASLFGAKEAGRSANLLKQSLKKLSTGLAIDSAKDNPAGLIASELLRSDLGALREAIDGATRSAGVLSTADAALGEINDMLSEARGLAVQAANTAGMPEEAAAALQQQMDATLDAVNRTANAAEFGGQKLLDGNMEAAIYEAGSIELEQVSTATLATGGDPAVESLETVRGGGANSLASNPAGAAQALERAILDVSTERGRIGSFVSQRIAPQIGAWQVALENMAAGESAIRDTDYAEEVSNLVKTQVMHNASLASQALGNSNAGSVLSLLR